jgi:predicted ArsR family transcriptional regulator
MGRTMSKDHIAEQVYWMDGIFTDAENPSLFHDETQLALQKELADRWVKENRLELLVDLAERYGEEKVLAVLDQIIYEVSKKNWEQLSQGRDNSLDNFIQKLWVPLKDSGFEFSFETRGNETKFRVTQCPMYNLAKQMDARKWFYHLVCLTDEPTVVGFNRQIEFRRTRTLMQGDPDCDHCYIDHSA